MLGQPDRLIPDIVRQFRLPHETGNTFFEVGFGIAQIPLRLQKNTQFQLHTLQTIVPRQHIILKKGTTWAGIGNTAVMVAIDFSRHFPSNLQTQHEYTKSHHFPKSLVLPS